MSGTRPGRAVARAALDEHADGLLDEEWVPLGPIERVLRQRRRPLAGSTGQLAQQLLDELRALLVRQRLELDRGRTHATSAPARTCVEQLWPGQAEDEHRRAHPVGDVLDQIEQRRLGPVDVLEEEDERLDVGDALHHLARGPRDLLRAPLALERLHQAGCEPEHVCDCLLGTALAELLERFFQRVVVGDAGRGFHHLPERPVGDTLAVRQGASDEDARPLHAVEELTREPALADARLAVDGEQVRAAVAEAALERVLEQLELVVPPDERRPRTDRPTRPVDHVDHAPGPQRSVDALQLDRAGILDDETSCRQPIRRRPDKDLTGTRRFLQARSQVHGLARRERGLGVVDDDLTCFDPDPRFQLQIVHRSAHREGSACRAKGVVLVRLRNAERRHHGVARELLDDAAVLLDAPRDHLEEARDAAPHDLGVSAPHETRGVDDVDEQHRCELALHD